MTVSFVSYFNVTPGKGGAGMYTLTGGAVYAGRSGMFMSFSVYSRKENTQNMNHMYTDPTTGEERVVNVEGLAKELGCLSPTELQFKVGVVGPELQEALETALSERKALRLTWSILQDLGRLATTPGGDIVNSHQVWVQRFEVVPYWVNPLYALDQEVLLEVVRTCVAPPTASNVIAARLERYRRMRAALPQRVQQEEPAPDAGMNPFADL